jgi:hypothetical protein
MAQPRTSRSTIKNDPFESVIPTNPPAEEPAATSQAELPPAAEEVSAGAKVVKPETVPSEPPPPPTPPEGRQKLTVHLEADVVNRVKNAAYWNPRLTIARIAERGIRLALREVEKDHGGAYPQREGELVGGRPIK